MKHLFFSLVVSGALLSPVQIDQDAELDLDDVLTSGELRAYQRKQRYTNRIDLFRRAFDLPAKRLRGFVNSGRMEEAADLLQKLQALSYHVSQESTNVEREKDLRSRQVKKLEIRLRKMIETIDDLKSTAPFEYHKEFARTSQALENLRKSLLVQIFGDTAQRSMLNEREDQAGSLAIFLHSLAGPISPPISPALLQTRDRFTEEEYVKIGENQELEKRVEVFLEIADSRLREIHRRMEKKEWDKEEENPLEFHTYWDMVHAYEKAIDGIMINIDEKAIHKLASEKDIEKSLKKLNKKLKEFIPLLEPIKKLAVGLQDEALYNGVVKAQNTSSIAEKGALYGLGAPEQ